LGFRRALRGAPAKKSGTEGKLGGPGTVPGGCRNLKDLTANVNFRRANLTAQVAQKLPMLQTANRRPRTFPKRNHGKKRCRAKILQLKGKRFNDMVDQFSTAFGRPTVGRASGRAKS